MRKKILYGVIFLIIVLLGLTIAMLREKRLLKNYRIANAIVTGAVNKRNSGKGFFLEYKFNLSEKYYYGNQKLVCPFKHKDEVASFLVGKEVNIAYDTLNPNNSRLLLTKKDFDKFKLRASKYDSILINKICSICSTNCP